MTFEDYTSFKVYFESSLNSLLVFACFCLLEIESRDSFMCERAIQILAAASIKERRLFRSTRLEGGCQSTVTYDRASTVVRVTCI